MGTKDLRTGRVIFSSSLRLTGEKPTLLTLDFPYSKRNFSLNCLEDTLTRSSTINDVIVLILPPDWSVKRAFKQTVVDAQFESVFEHRAILSPYQLADVSMRADTNPKARRNARPKKFTFNLTKTTLLTIFNDFCSWNIEKSIT